MGGESGRLFRAQIRRDAWDDSRDLFQSRVELEDFLLHAPICIK